MKRNELRSSQNKNMTKVLQGETIQDQ